MSYNHGVCDHEIVRPKYDVLHENFKCRNFWPQRGRLSANNKEPPDYIPRYSNMTTLLIDALKAADHSQYVESSR